MAMATTLTDGVSTINFYDTTVQVVRNSQANTLGEAMVSPRTVSLDIRYNPNRNRTREQIFQDVNAARIMLNKATEARIRGLGRLVTLTVQTDGLSVPTSFYVLGGRIPVESVWDLVDLVNTRLAPLIELDIEPLGRSPDVNVITSGSLYGINAGVIYHFLHYTGATVFGTNNVGRTEGNLWQSDRLTTAPTLRVPQSGDVLYWGNDFSGAVTLWDRIVFGIRTARTGTAVLAWEYSNGAGGWTGFSPTSSFRSNQGSISTEFDTAADMGEINWAGQPMTGWGNNTVNGISALWVRLRFSTVSSMPVVPVMMNGPFRSHMGISYIPANTIKGDVAADALVHYMNNSGGNDIAGVRTALACGPVLDFMPPFIAEWEDADLYAPTSGDVSVATSAPPTASAASGGADVAITVGTAIGSAADRAQHFTGPTPQYITATVASGDKVDAFGNDSFVIEVLFYLDSVPQDPTPLCSRWSSTTSAKVFWAGIDQGRLRYQVFNSGGSRKVVEGTTDLTAGRFYLATFEFVSGSREIRIYLDAVQEATHDVGKPKIRTGQTTALRVGSSVSFSTGDAKDGNSAEVGLNGKVSYLWMFNQRIAEAFTGPGHYADSYPPDHERVSGDATASAQLLWNMNDYAATATITDTGVGTAKPGTRTGAPVNTNDAANAALGYYSGGGFQTKAIGTRLAQYYGDEGAGTYRVLMAAAPPASGFTDLTSLELSLQFNVGDINLPIVTASRRFPDVANVRGSSRYFLLDFGPVTLPPAAMWDGHRVNDTARDFLQCYLFVKSTLPSATVFWVDCLYFLPLDSWYAEYTSFRDTMQTGYQVVNQAGVLFDGRGPELVIGQTRAVANPWQFQTRNPYARWDAGNPRLTVQRAAWLFAIPVYPENLTNDQPTRIGLNSLTPRVIASPNWLYAASA